MPAQVQKSPLAGKLNASLARHAKDRTEYGQDFGELPGGIHGGVAQIVGAKMGTYKKGDNEGQPYVLLQATVIEPVKAIKTEKVWDPNLVNPVTKKKGGVKVVGSVEVTVEGMQFNNTLPLCATSRGDKVLSDDDNIKIAMNAIRMVSSPDYTDDVRTDADLQVKLEALVTLAPYFRFSTTQMDPSDQYPNARVFVNWLGNKGMENYSPGEAPAIVDNTPPAKAAAAPNGKPPTKAPPTERSAVTSKALAKTKEPEPEPEPEEETEALTPSELAKAAGEGDDDAVAKLTEMALAAGVTQEELDDPDTTWEGILEKMEQAGTEEAEEEASTEEEAEEEAAEETEFVPTIGEVHLMFIPDAKTGKKPKKASEVEIKSVNKDKRTVTLELVDTNKMLIDLKTKRPLQVSWDTLEKG